MVLTARYVRRGTEAVEKLKASYGLSGVVFHQLDVTSSTSIASQAEFLKTQVGKLDILVIPVSSYESCCDVFPMFESADKRKGCSTRTSKVSLSLG